MTNGSIIDTDKFVAGLLELAYQYPGQPVATILDDQGLRIGVMTLCDPAAEDWCLNPVPVEQFPPAELLDPLDN